MRKKFDTQSKQLSKQPFNWAIEPLMQEMPVKNDASGSYEQISTFTC